MTKPERGNTTIWEASDRACLGNDFRRSSTTWIPIPNARFVALFCVS